MIEPIREDRAGAVFATLADPMRRRLVRELSADGPLTPTALAARLPISLQAVAKHLAALVDAGLATASREGPRGAVRPEDRALRRGGGVDARDRSDVGRAVARVA